MARKKEREEKEKVALKKQRESEDLAPESRPQRSSTLDLQRKVGNRAFGELLEGTAGQLGVPENPVPDIVHDVLDSPGQPLDQRMRGIMEFRFGKDLSKVRVHTDARAAESAKAVNALAYTVGKDVVFAAGQYAPTQEPGLHLLAHELTHTIQQSSNRDASGLRIGDPGSPMEHEADQAARAIRHGDSYSPSLSGNAVVARQGPAPAVPPGPPPPTKSETPATDQTSQQSEDPVWVVPPGVRPGSVSIYDTEDTHAVIGFKYSSGGYWEVFDLEGKLVEAGEIGLEQPLIDPIDIVAGLLTGGLLSGGRAASKAVTKGAAGMVERAAAETAAEAGFRALLRTIGRKSIDAIRATYRALKFRGPLNFTVTTAQRMADPARRVPEYILKLALRFGKREADPQKAAGAFRYAITMFKNGKPYTLEVVIREADRTILHFLYK